MAGDAGQRAIEDLVLHSLVLHPAAAAVLDGDDAVDVGKLLEDLLIESIGNVLADGRRAVDGRDNRQIVPRPRFAARPLVAEKRAPLDRLGGRRDGSRRRVVAGKLAVDQVVRMHPAAGLDAAGRLTNDLAELANELAF